ncbi:MAG: monofunctional biosynthetic peptidoglycan transglycosylase [Gammaproteobacteria bacterium]|nr:monofunctional biosynthetic peptidoglycan transglycosylase [Gammaproteobacteria bacterium]
MPRWLSRAGALRGPMVESRRRPARLGRRLRRLFALLLLVWILGSAGLVLLLRWVDPPVSAVMLQRLVGEGAQQRQEWTDIDRIDPFMSLAVVAAEDQRFPDHWGFDPAEIIAAVERHLDGERLRGASTISQQVARNLFLWQGRSFVRKGLEVWFTGLIELTWPKRRILEMYLNFAETGERLFGVGVASRHYFGLDPGRLGRQKAALLAAVLPNPVVYRVDSPSDLVRKRRDWILQQMDNLGGPAYLDRVMRGD